MHSACFWKCWDLLDQGFYVSCFIIRDCVHKKYVYIIPFMNTFILVLQLLPDISLLCDDSGLVRKKLAWLGLNDLVYSLISSVTFVFGSTAS